MVNQFPLHQTNTAWDLETERLEIPGVTNNITANETSGSDNDTFTTPMVAIKK